MPADPFVGPAGGSLCDNQVAEQQRLSAGVLAGNAMSPSTTKTSAQPRSVLALTSSSTR
jgi:hypothetical protein